MSAENSITPANSTHNYFSSQASALKQIITNYLKLPVMYSFNTADLYEIRSMTDTFFFLFILMLTENFIERIVKSLIFSFHIIRQFLCFFIPILLFLTFLISVLFSYTVATCGPLPLYLYRKIQRLQLMPPIKVFNKNKPPDYIQNPAHTDKTL